MWGLVSCAQNGKAVPRVLLRGGGRLGHASATSVTDSGGDGDLISGSPAIFQTGKILLSLPSPLS